MSADFTEHYIKLLCFTLYLWNREKKLGSTVLFYKFLLGSRCTSTNAILKTECKDADSEKRDISYYFIWSNSLIVFRSCVRYFRITVSLTNSWTRHKQQKIRSLILYFQADWWFHSWNVHFCCSSWTSREKYPSVFINAVASTKQ